MFFEDSLHGWIVGSDTSDNGIILETIDGGYNWAIQNDGLIAPLHSIHFKGNYGWVVGELGLVLWTDDGGANWITGKNKKVFPDKYELKQRGHEKVPESWINTIILILKDVKELAT